ncbi:MAG TPA: alkaline phosphatase family protein, partial [Rhodanobacteraceae bacterium]|nr:alkaline phosphatase family protein [Rhodanobacteraceae bacterium]
IGPAEFAADTDDIDHSHPLMLRKLHVVGGVPRMDRFALTEERKYSPQGTPSLRALQFGELAMAHEDCDTVPILWHYADRFALFDRVFQTIAGPSTPGNLSIIAAQTGVTQWARHPGAAFKGDGARGPGVPVVDDADPLWGSPYDPTPAAQRMPYNPHDTAKTAAHRDEVQDNLTFASLPLTLQGGDLDHVALQDTRPASDLADVRGDVRAISTRGQRTVDWRWYQAGYGAPTAAGADPEDAEGQHASYVTHHNGPQYFGYIANNPALRAHLADLSRFFGDLRDGRLPAAGGVFYIKGGYRNDFGLKPADPDPRVQARFLGDDDHPQYSDAQISEILVARAINAIAASPYWKHSAIILTWDDSEGDYDHVPPPQRATGPDGRWLGNGPRVPLLLISPYARVHAVIHAPGNTASVVKFVDRVFDLPPLATLPDELEGRKLGELHFHLHGLGPEDALTPDVTDLLGAFDPARLAGRAAPLPASYAMVPTAWTEQLPGALGLDCKALGIVPVDRQLGIRTPLPPQFNPRPKTTPTRSSAAPR